MFRDDEFAPSTVTDRPDPNTNDNNKKLMKGKALRKHSLHEKTAANVL